MDNENEVIGKLTASGLLGVLSWAAPAAFAATEQVYDEDAGHDQSVIGTLNYKHLQDLIDRATSNGRYRRGVGVDGFGSDVLKRGVTPEVFQSMPRLEEDAITRSNYQQSPGWAIPGVRILLQSYSFGEIEEIKWAERSEAKRRVASQGFVSENTLFEDHEFGLESEPGILGDEAFEGVTLVAAHAFNPSTKQFELYVGQSKNAEYPKDSCWYWKQLLLSGGAPIGDIGLARPPVLPGDAASTNVEDVAVRIKTQRPDKSSGSVSG